MGKGGRQKPGSVGDIASHIEYYGGFVIDVKIVVKGFERSLKTGNPSHLAEALSRGANLNGRDPYGIAKAIVKHHESYNPYR